MAEKRKKSLENGSGNLPKDIEKDISKETQKQLVQTLGSKVKEFYKSDSRKNLTIGSKKEFIDALYAYIQETESQDYLSKIDENFFAKTSFESLKNIGLKTSDFLTLGLLKKELQLSSGDERSAMEMSLTNLMKQSDQPERKQSLQDYGLSFADFAKTNNVVISTNKCQISPKLSGLRRLGDIKKSRYSYIKSKVPADKQSTGIIAQILSDTLFAKVLYDPSEKIIMHSAANTFASVISGFVKKHPSSLLHDFQVQCGDILDTTVTVDAFSALQHFDDFTRICEDIFGVYKNESRYVEFRELIANQIVSYKDVYETGKKLGYYGNDGETKDTAPIATGCKSFFGLFKKVRQRQIIKDTLAYSSVLQQVVKDTEQSFHPIMSLQDLLMQGKSLPGYSSTLQRSEDKILSIKIHTGEKELAQLHMQKKTNPSSEILEEIAKKENELRQYKYDLVTTEQNATTMRTWIEAFAKKQKNPALASVLEKLRRGGRNTAMLSVQDQQVLAQIMLNESLEQIDTVAGLYKDMGIDLDAYKGFMRGLYDCSQKDISIPIGSGSKKIVLSTATNATTSALKKGIVSRGVQMPMSIEEMASSGQLPFVVSIDMHASGKEVEDFLYKAYAASGSDTMPLSKFYPKNKGSLENGGVYISDGYKVTLTNSSGQKVSGYLSAYGPIQVEEHGGQELYLYDSPVSLPDKKRKIVQWDNGNPVIIANKLDQQQYDLTIDQSEQNIHLSGEALQSIAHIYLASAMVDEDAANNSDDGEKAIQSSIGSMMGGDAEKAKTYIDDNQQVDLDPLYTKVQKTKIEEQIDEREQLCNARDAIDGYPKKNSMQAGESLVVGSRLLMHTSQGSWFPPEGLKQSFFLEITGINKGVYPHIITRKVCGAEDNVGGLSDMSYKIPMTQSFIDKIKRDSGLKRFGPLEKSGFNQLLDGLNKGGEMEKERKDLQGIQWDGTTFKKNKRPIKFYVADKDAPSFTLPNRGNKLEQQKVFFDIEKKGAKYRVSTQYITQDITKDGTKKNVKKKHTADLDEQGLLAFFIQRQSLLHTAYTDIDPVSGEKESEYKKIQDMEKNKQEGFSANMPKKPRTFVSFKAIAMGFKDLVSGVKSKLDDNVKNQKDELLDSIYGGDDGFFKKRGSSIPIVGGALSDMYYTHKKEKDSKMMQKIQSYIDTRFSKDMHHTTMILSEIVPLFSKIANVEIDQKGEIKKFSGMKGPGHELSYDDRLAACAAWIWMMEKETMYGRGMKQFLGSGIYIRAIFGYDTWLRFMSARDKIEKESESGKDSTPLQTMVRLEIDFAKDNLRGGYHFSKAGKPNELFLQQYPRALAGKLGDAFDGSMKNDGWNGDYENIKQINRFDWALSEFNDAIKANRVTNAYGILRAMSEMVSTPEQRKQYQSCFMMGLMSGLFYYGTNKAFKFQEMSTFARSTGMPIGSLITKPNHQEQMKFFFDMAMKAPYFLSQKSEKGSFDDTTLLQYKPSNFKFSVAGQNVDTLITTFPKRRGLYSQNVVDFFACDPTKPSMMQLCSKLKEDPSLAKKMNISSEQMGYMDDMLGYYDQGSGGKGTVEDGKMNDNNFSLYQDVFAGSSAMYNKFFTNAAFNDNDKSDIASAIGEAVEMKTKTLEQLGQMNALSISDQEQFNFYMKKFLTIFSSFFDQREMIKLARILGTIRENPQMPTIEKERLIAMFTMGSMVQKNNGSVLVDPVRKSIQSYINFFCSNLHMFNDSTMHSVDKYLDSSTAVYSSYADQYYGYIPSKDWPRGKSKDIQNKKIQIKNAYQKTDPLHDLVNEEIDSMIGDTYGSSSKQIGLKDLDSLTSQGKKFKNTVLHIVDESIDGTPEEMGNFYKQKEENSVREHKEQHATGVSIINPTALEKNMNFIVDDTKLSDSFITVPERAKYIVDNFIGDVDDFIIALNQNTYPGASGANSQWSKLQTKGDIMQWLSSKYSHDSQSADRFRLANVLQKYQST